MLRNVVYIKSGWRIPALRHCSSFQSEQRPDYGDERKYGYKPSSFDGHPDKRDKDNPALVHLTKIDLPAPLKENLQLYIREQPSHRLMAQDGLKLSRYLKNRGRPTDATWARYREAQKEEEGNPHNRQPRTRGARADIFKRYDFDEAKKAGLVPEYEEEEAQDEGRTLGDEEFELEREKEEVEEDKAEDSKDNDEAAAAAFADHSNPIDNDDSWNTEPPPKTKQTKTHRRPLERMVSTIRYGKREAAAFAGGVLPTVYGSTFKVFHEIHKREPDYQPSTLLDFGSGTGMSVWAAHSTWGKSIIEYQCVDPSNDMNATANFLLRGSKDYTMPCQIPNVFFKQFLPLSNQIKYDIVVAGYTLTEMPFMKQRLQAIQSLWRKTKDFLVIIEPGNNEGFETALKARNYVLKTQGSNVEDFVPLENMFGIEDDFDEDYDEKGHIFAPCPHEEVCARTDVDTRDHPCNFTQKVELSMAYRKVPRLKARSFSSDMFSYIVFRKGEREGGRDEDEDGREWTRILGPPKKRRNHVICEMCCQNGNIEKHTLTKKKDPHLYKAARHVVQWGDRFPHIGYREPRLEDVRTPPPMCSEKDKK